jgi:aconitate hydratase
VLLAAGLLAKKAVERACACSRTSRPRWRPARASSPSTSTRPAAALPGAARLPLAGYGCTTCIGNSGDLTPEINEAITQSDLVCAAVLSGNRNFEARIHPNLKANFLASPPLVVAYAIAGTVLTDLMTSRWAGHGRQGRLAGRHLAVQRRDPQADEVRHERQGLPRELRQGEDRAGRAVEDIQGVRATPTTGPEHLHRRAAVLRGFTLEPPAGGRAAAASRCDARIMALFGDSITTDHISPAGSIKDSSPAGQWLLAHGVRKPTSTATARAAATTR